MQIGTGVGAAVGVTTGPVAVLTAVAGGLFFGVAGRLGADWIAEYISENPEK